MGGGGGGGGTSGGSTPRKTFTSCIAIEFTTVLLSARPDVLAVITVGEVLTLTLAQQQSTLIVIAVRQSGEMVGSLGSVYLQQLIDCMKENHQYEAVVLSIEGGECRVRVRHAQT